MYSKVYVEITNVCNMSCSFCHGHSRPPRRMSIEEFSCILDQLTEQTQYIYYHLMGEPLTHPQLPELIQLAKARGYKSVITTNGTLLPRRKEALLAAGVHKVNISVHSFEEGSEENHVQYLTGLADFAKSAAEAGTIVVFRLWNRGFDQGKNHLALETLKQHIPGDWVENTRGLRVRDRIFVEMDERFEWPDSSAELKGDRIHCYGLRSQFGILVDGTVVPCCLDSDGVISLGNIFQENIQTILSSQRAQVIREGFLQGKATEDLCKRCGFAQRFAR